MTTIVVGSQVVTSITFFTVEPENQQQLVELVVRAVQEVVRKQPGFLSANIHRSLDQTQVVSYSQWENRHAFNDMLQHTTFIPYLQQVLKLATMEPHLYEVVAVVNADSSARQPEQSRGKKRTAKKSSKSGKSSKSSKKQRAGKS